MKNTCAILFLLFTVIGSTQAQINPYSFPRPIPQTPPLDLRFNCADLEVKLEIHRIDKVSGHNFRVTFKASLKNIGRVDFNDWDNPAQASLRVTSSHPKSGEDAVMLIPELKVGASRVTYLSMPWSATWRVAPNVNFSLNTHPADCNRNNNRASITHRTIVQRFRLERLGSLPFGRY